MANNSAPSRSESQDVANKQESVGGQRKEIDVKDYQEAQSLGQALKNLNFPASKSEILAFVEQQDRTSELLSKLRVIAEKQYSNSSEVAKASGIAYSSSSDVTPGT
jgi:hypothetical protein